MKRGTAVNNVYADLLVCVCLALITADYKVLNEEGESRTITDTQSWYKIPPLSGFNLIRAKRKLRRRRKNVHESFSSLLKAESHAILTSRWNLASPVKTYHGIIVLRHAIGPRRVVLLRQQHAESRKGRLLYCCIQAWMNKWWAWFYGIQLLLYELFKTSRQMGKSPCARQFGEPFKGPVILFAMFSDFCTRPAEAPPIGQESFTWDIPRICINRWRIWKGDNLVADTEELENMDASEIFPRRINAKEVF